MRYGLLFTLALLTGGCVGPHQPNFAKRTDRQSTATTQHEAPASQIAAEAASQSALEAARLAVSQTAHRIAVADNDIRPPRAVNPHEARRWRRLQWIDEDGRIPDGALGRAVEQLQANVTATAERGQRLTAGIDPDRWDERGPYNVGGRTRSLVIRPDNPRELWAGAVSGGIWHSTDGGGSWQLVDDWLPNLAICCLAIDPSNPDVMYAGTGEGFFNADGIGGAGIYKTIDGGVTWAQLPFTASWDNVNRIAVSPGHPNIILASRHYGGIYRSANGGQTWTTPLWAQVSCFVAFDPTDGSKAVAHIMDYDWDISDWYHYAVYSTDGGSHWTPATGLDHVPGFNGRIEFAYAPSNPDIVYASCADGGGVIWRSTDGGRSYIRQTEPGYTSGANWYANPLWVDPTNPDFLVTGGVYHYKSTDGGRTLTQISGGYIMTDQPHVDMHYIVHDPRFDGVTNKRVYVCTDGGTWVTDNIYAASANGGGGWARLDFDYRTVQYFSAAGHGPGGLIIGGTQDNGTLRLQDGSNQAHLTFGGDGGFCAIDPTDPSFCYGETIFLQVIRSTDGGQSANWIFSGLSDAGASANFIAPIALDPNEPNTMLAGGRSLWRCTNVKQTTGGQPFWRSIRGPGNDNISAIAAAKGNSDVIWIGLNNGEVHRTANGAAVSPTWTPVDNNGGLNPFPDRYVTRIVIDPNKENVVYVCLGGFASNNIWKTTDGGANWNYITGTLPTGLPYAPIRGLARHPLRPDWLYAGTEVGVFATPDGGQTWSATNEGPANVSVDELTFMHDSTTLLAATHGRGIFTVDVPGAAPLDFDLDGDTDLEDYRAFAECHAGPDHAPSPPWPLTVDICLRTYDADEDGDIDLSDFAALQSGFTGPR